MQKDEGSLQQMIADDLSDLKSYYLELSSEEGPGVLLVHVYKDAEVCEQSARFLKASQVPAYVAEAGLSKLQAQFESHDPETEMPIALSTEDEMDSFLIEIQRPRDKKLPNRKKQPKAKGFGIS